MDRNDDARLEGRIHGEQADPAPPGGPNEPGPYGHNLLMRLVFMVVIAIMLSLSQTVLTAITLLQFVIMLFSKGEPNERLADFGTDLGIWMAKAVRFQTAGSEVKPWPWTDLD